MTAGHHVRDIRTPCPRYSPPDNRTDIGGLFRDPVSGCPVYDSVEARATAAGDLGVMVTERVDGGARNPHLAKATRGGGA